MKALTSTPAPSRTITVERINYTVCEIEGGRRLKTWARIGQQLKSVTATTEARLRAKLRKISVDLLNGQTEAAELESTDHRAYIAAREALRPFGISVDLACREYAAARSRIGEASLGEVVSFYQQHSGEITSRPTVRVVIDEFLISLQRRSEAYRKVFRNDLERFARFLGGGELAIADLSLESLEQFVASTGRLVAGKFVASSDYRREQVRTELVTFLNFARRRRYLPKRLTTVAHDLTAEETISEAREVWDPEHLRLALESVAEHDPEWLPWLAISAFGNVRSVATRRLEWSRVHWQDGLIELPARSSKVKKRVTIQITPALATWLDPYRQATGMVCPAKGHHHFTDRLRKKYGLPYYPNVLRKSFITYLLAQTNDEDHVARTANTSVQKLRENYRQIRTFKNHLVTQELAARWFGTLRVEATNVVPIDRTAVVP